MDNQHNPFHAHIEEFHGVLGSDLTNQWNGRRNPSFEDVSSLNELLIGKALDGMFIELGNRDASENEAA